MATSNNSKVMGISIGAIAIALVALFLTSFSIATNSSDVIKAEQYEPQTREIYLFSQVDENIDEDKFGIPPDQFSLDSIIVKKGNKVKINFYNLEPIETQEHHTFTMNLPYEMNYDINAGENVVIEFTAAANGVFDYLCTYHEPTMRGQLVVLDS
ncbi:MAG: cupredoxin domain-containing protein [Nitrososphaerota archaeon]